MKYIVSLLLMCCSFLAFANVEEASETQSIKPGMGVLYMFQKCDMRFAGDTGYDAVGCPTTPGIWPVLFENHRWGKLKYNIFGGNFDIDFEGHHLKANKNYTLIYSPAPWPAEGLICLADGKTNSHGYLKFHSSIQLRKSLPVETDLNFINGVGAKMLLIVSDDVNCGPIPQSQLIENRWDPENYLFEYNPIVFEYLGG